jgi:DNA-binding response OmpR family regulator
VLIVDDDASIRDAVQLTLEFQREAFTIQTAQDGEAGLEAILRWQPDIVVLDIGLPKMDGLELLTRIRKVSSARVVMLSAKGRDADVAKALEAGADDYVRKPFSVLELTARIRAQARRIDHSAMSNGVAAAAFAAGDLKIDFRTHDVHIGNNRIKLSETEYQLLCHLVQNADRILSYRTLLQLVWGSENYKNDVVRVYISRLRKKIESGHSTGIQIITKPGIGYMLKVPDGTPRDGAGTDSASPEAATSAGKPATRMPRRVPEPAVASGQSQSSRWSKQRTARPVPPPASPLSSSSLAGSHSFSSSK